jgi:hypothetical protein
MNRIQPLIGVAGGIASALLFAAMLGGGLLGIPLLALSPLPIAIAGLGWGTVAGFVAAAVAAGLIGLTIAPIVGLSFAIVAVFPIAWYAHLAGLARQNAEGGVEWYPLWRVFTAMVLITPATLIASWLLLGLSVETIATNFADAVLESGVQTPDGGPPDRADLIANMSVYVRLMPVTMTMVWLSLLVFNLWLAGRVVLKSDRLRRGWEAVPAAPGLPPTLILLTLVAIALAFGESTLALASSAVAGALVMGFALQGFATLHVVTRRNPARGLLLGALYTATFLFSLPLVPVALLGAADAIMGIRRRRLAGV